ncbi:MAG: TolC family protein [Bdellovibrionota bacterium]
MILAVLLLLNSTFAANCTSIKTYKEFYKCTLEKHPEFEVAKLKIQEAEAVIDKASQWQNPNLDVKSISGKLAGENIGSTELSLSIPLSQIWTRGAQMDAGRADKKIADIEAQLSLLSVKKQLIKDIFRLRQVNDEIELNSEALGAYDKIKNQFKARLARGPEQEITFNLVELATSDYELKKNHLTTERTEILARIKGIWGAGFDIKKEYLPPPKEKWPELPKEINIGQSFESRKVMAESDKASAEYNLAVRESWPEVSAGPTVERSTEGPVQYTSSGFNLSISVPILSWNGGGRNLAETKAKQSRLLSEYAHRKAQIEREIVIHKYRSAVESLKKSSAREDVRKKHTRIDSLFRQGLASGGLIIEAHRQITEYTESQHEHEVSAIEAYLDIKALTGDENIEELLQ